MKLSEKTKKDLWVMSIVVYGVFVGFNSINTIPVLSMIAIAGGFTLAMLYFSYWREQSIPNIFP